MQIDLNRLRDEFVTDESGAGAIEYALLAVLIAVAVVGVLTLVGQSGVMLYQSICSGISSVVNGGGC